MRKVSCMCETVFDTELPEEIDLDERPRTFSEILSGDFFAVICPNCGSRLKPELRVRLVSKKSGTDLLVLPELERDSFYMGAVELPAGSEVLVGYAELFERARILADGLDPEVIEILKLWLLEKAEEQSTEADITATYAGKKDGKLCFHLSGIKEGQIAILPIDPSIYDQAQADKNRSKREPPFDRVFRGPYKSIRALETEEGD